MRIVDVALPLPLENLFSYYVPDKLERVLSIGQQVTVPFQKRVLQGVIVKIHSQENSSGEIEKKGSPLKELISILPSSTLPKQLLELTFWLSESYACSWGEALSLVWASWGRVKVASWKEEERSVSSLPFSSLLATGENASALLSSSSLNGEKKEAVEKIKTALLMREQKFFLLFGDEAMGRTEVYLQIIQDIFLNNDGAQILFLVPEISLCQSFYEILSGKFSQQLRVWHSLIARKEKWRIAEDLSSGKSMILLGTRSALFAPFKNLRAIIFEEEHSSSYKHQEKPRYHAREVAIKLSQLHKAICIFGSSTPSIEIYYRAERKEFVLLKLCRRVDSQSVPSLIILDRRKALQKKKLFCPELIDALQVCLARREQAILVLNRRGYSTFFLCAECNFLLRCPHCELALVRFQEETSQGNKDWIGCHYCHYKQSLPTHCEKCKSTFLIEGGAGTQKVVAELKKLFPFARILRLDRDILTRRAITQTVQSFQNERADILVGTQMVCQGFDFPRVTVVGIVDSDSALYQPDFRAAEKTFQWIYHFAGRNLGVSDRKVFVQTGLPSHYALRSACLLDYEAFYREEIEFRKNFFFPPYCRLLLLRLESSKKKEQVPPDAERLAETLKSKISGDGIQILGASPSPKEQLRKKRRWQVLLKCEQEQKLWEAIRIAKSFPLSSGIRMIMDTDPVQIT